MEEKDISSCLQNLCLDVVKNQDGRDLSEYHLGSLATVAEVAERLDLADAAKFRTLANVARKGHTRDLTRAALALLTS